MTGPPRLQPFPDESPAPRDGRARGQPPARPRIPTAAVRFETLGFDRAGARIAQDPPRLHAVLTPAATKRGGRIDRRRAPLKMRRPRRHAPARPREIQNFPAGVSILYDFGLPQLATYFDLTVTLSTCTVFASAFMVPTSST
jgi:hypothetical protein